MRAGTELKFENYGNYESVQQFSGIKKGAKIYFIGTLSGKWKADERFKAWIAANPASKTKAMCVVFIRPLIFQEWEKLQSHVIGK